MNFISLEFLLFFVAVILLRSCFRDFKAEKWFLLGASYVFIASWSITTGLVLLCISLVTYFVGLGFARFEDGRRRRFLLVISIAVNLGVLVFFKYTGFLLDNVWGILTLLGVRLNRWHYNIGLPVSISFCTFIAMTYAIDIYRRSMRPQCSLEEVLLFVGYFPQILSGPIRSRRM